MKRINDPELNQIELLLTAGVSMGNISQEIKDKVLNYLLGTEAEKDLVLIKLLTKNKVAEIIDCSTRQINRYVEQGKLRPEILSNQIIRFHLSQVLRFGKFEEQIINNYRVYI